MVKRSEWDPTKAHISQKKHGLRFEDATKLFASDAAMLWWRDRRIAHETRYAGLGFLDACLCHVVFTMRAGWVRIIQFRKASRDERKAYKQHSETGTAPRKPGKKTVRRFYKKDV